MYLANKSNNMNKRRRVENNELFAKIIQNVLKKKIEGDDDESDEDETDEMDDERIYKKDNHIYFRCEVSETTVSKLRILMERYRSEVERIKRNKYVEEVKTKSVYIHLTTYGGCLISGLNMYDYIKDYNRDIEVIIIVDGNAFSSGALMTMAAGKRYITPNSFILIHQLSTYNGRQKYEELLDDKKNCDELMSKTRKIFLERCNFTKKELDQLLKRDLYLTAEECIKKGVVDEIRVR